MTMENQQLYASLDENGIVENYSTINYSHSVLPYFVEGRLITNNGPFIVAKYDVELNAFIPPKPEDGNYVFNTETFQWELDQSETI